MRTSSFINYYVLCLVFWILLGISGVSTRSHSKVKRMSGLYTGPYFDSSSATNITAQLGTRAFLPCRVRQLGNKSVSWVRKKDSHILSVDRAMFIADDRFQSIFVENADTWKLLIKYVQAKDEGEYECQISTEPKMSHIIKLNVVVPKVEIETTEKLKGDLFVKSGSTVTLRCVIKQSLEDPSFVLWFHKGERLLNYDGGDKVQILKKHVDGITDYISNLIIPDTKKQDSGNYTCTPNNLGSASVMLHVLNGEHPAAIQRGKSSIPGCCEVLWWLAGGVTLSQNNSNRLLIFVLTAMMVVLTQSFLPYPASAVPR
ncbi:cell adhesion molecule DSCAML1-like [Leptopilina boulardi]|uniref:cell adhesion molecule DSCAML1-like n=1 Tax=Leptopilina boulardi TaxID=63433 RepID=UPI0021F59B34|nr:cell adhesion molecule DSCAML1-like [Leptopilina boulardi]